ncbi:MAG: DNA repair protein RecO [Verrucomicrobiales bacterium]|nr:DNA repair protein RecO [Verrucomicrobiales bacterium]
MNSRTDERTTGVILRTRLLTETSLIVHWLTGDCGRIATVAKGARRPKSPFRGKLDLFYVADLTFRRSRHSELHALLEVGARASFPEFRNDWRRLTRAAYGVALIEQTTETDTPVPETFRLFLGYLEHLGGAQSGASSVLALELRHLADMGMEPDWDRGNLSGEARALAERLVEGDWRALDVRSVDGEAELALARFLHGFLIFHLGRLPRGRSDALGTG